MFFALLISELFEEFLEDVIATGITWIIGKVVNVLLVITLTQGTKILIKRIVKSITYKEGNDKMKVLRKLGIALKNSWLFVWNNKITATLVGVGAFAGYCFYDMAILPYVWANILVAILIGLISAILSIKVGAETLTQIIERLASTKLSKEKIAEEKAKKKAIEEKTRELEKKAHAEMEARAKELVEAERLANNK